MSSPATGTRTMVVLGLLLIAAGSGVLTGLSSGDGWGPLTTAMILIGAGAGLVMPAATSALMGAVPAESAVVGSALNDPIQQAGSALGVAVLGAVLSSTYTSEMPVGAPGAARHAVSEALVLAARTRDEGLAAAAREAFTSAMSVTFLVGVCGVLGAAVLALFLMQNRATEAAAKEAARPQDQFATVAGP